MIEAILGIGIENTSDDIEDETGFDSAPKLFDALAHMLAIANKSFGILLINVSK